MWGHSENGAGREEEIRIEKWKRSKERPVVVAVVVILLLMVMKVKGLKRIKRRKRRAVEIQKVLKLTNELPKHGQLFFHATADSATTNTHTDTNTHTHTLCLSLFRSAHFSVVFMMLFPWLATGLSTRQKLNWPIL